MGVPSEHEIKIKVITEERYRANVEQERPHDRQNHHYMPGRDFHRNHQQLVQHQHCITDGNHPRPVDFGQDLRQALDYTALVYRDKHPNEECAIREGAARGEFLVEFGVEIRKVLVDVLVKNKRYNWCGSIDGRITDQKPVLDEF